MKIFQLINNESLQKYIAYRKLNNLIRVHFDATGNSINDENILFPIAEMLTCDQTPLNIEFFLRNVSSKLKKLSIVFPNIADYVVVDWSWAEFNAVIKLNLCSVTEYLDLMYNAMEKEDLKIIEHLNKIASCSSHFTKMILGDVRNHFQERDSQNMMTELIVAIMTIEKFQAMDELIQDILMILKKPRQDRDFKKTQQKLQSFFNNPANHGDFKEVDLGEPEESKTLYKNSKFFDRYSKLQANVNGAEGNPVNKFYNPSFASIFIKKYLAYLPFWGGAFMANDVFGSRPNNGSVEKYFSEMKTENRKRNNNKVTAEKVGRYVKFHVESTEIKKLRIDLKVKTQRLTKLKIKEKIELDDEQKDNWKDKSTSKYHSRKFVEKFEYFLSLTLHMHEINVRIKNGFCCTNAAFAA
jgi:hypothetical protein